MKNSLIKPLIGIGISISCTLILLFIFSIVLTYTGLNESTISPVIITITGISIFIGSSITTVKLKRKGIINGMIVGGMYICIIYLISSLLSKEFSLNYYSIIMILIGVICGAIGGIVGVNIK